MAFLVSPGVQIVEKDLTNIIPSVATSIGGFAGKFEWGPALDVTTVSSEKDLIAKFGYPKVLGSSSADPFRTSCSIPMSSRLLMKSMAQSSFCLSGT